MASVRGVGLHVDTNAHFSSCALSVERRPSQVVRANQVKVAPDLLTVR